MSLLAMSYFDTSACTDLLAAVLRRAVLDARSGNGRSAAARAWLWSDDCAHLVEALGLDAGAFRRRLAGALRHETIGVQDDERSSVS